MTFRLVGRINQRYSMDYIARIKNKNGTIKYIKVYSFISDVSVLFLHFACNNVQNLLSMFFSCPVEAVMFLLSLRFIRKIRCSTSGVQWL